MSIEQKFLFLFHLSIAPLAAFILSVILTKYLIKPLRILGFTAEMGERHIHKKITPTAGGTAMILAFVSGCVFFNFWLEFKNFSSEVQPINFKFFLPLIVLFVIGILDDRLGMRPFIKLIGQISAAILTWYCGIRLQSFFGIVLNDFFSCSLTVLWFMAFINAFNLIDGLDGLAAGLALIAGLTMGVVLIIGHHWSDAITVIILAAVCLGFLRYNFHPAKLFMGDTGSMFLGYVLAALGMRTSHYNTSVFALILPLMACGVPLFDTFLAIWRRSTFKILSKHSWREVMSADRSHLHHRILDAQHGNQSKTAFAIYTLALFMSTVGIISSIIVDMLPMLAVLLIVLTMIMVLRKFAVIEIWNSTLIVFKGLAMPRRGILLNILQPVYDMVVINGSFLVSILLFETVGTERDFLYRTVVSSLILVLSLTLSKSYEVYWLRAGTPDYLNLFYSVTIGFIIVLAVNGIVNYYLNLYWSFIVLLPAYLISIVTIIGERMHLRILKLILSRYFQNSEFNKKSVVPIILYGAENLSAYYSYSNPYLRKSGCKVVGIIDDDQALDGLEVYGCKILGDISKLQNIYYKYKFRKMIVLIQNPIRKNYEILKKFCVENNIELKFFTLSETDEPFDIRENPKPPEDQQ